MRLHGSKLLLGTCFQAGVKNQRFGLNRETADRCAIFTSGYLEVQLHVATHSLRTCGGRDEFLHGPAAGKRLGSPSEVPF